MKTFLVALDTSPRAHHVLQAAIDLARASGSKLLLFRALEIPPGLPETAWALSSNELREVLEREGRRTLDTLAHEVPKDLLDTVRVAFDKPWRAICAAARDERADLIVIGAHGYGTAERLLGTTAARVVDHADRSVLVVRPSHADEA
jgi:nucleotide-binding universal stress UspA family protein